MDMLWKIMLQTYCTKASSYFLDMVSTMCTIIKRCMPSCLVRHSMGWLHIRAEYGGPSCGNDDHAWSILLPASSFIHYLHCPWYPWGDSVPCCGQQTSQRHGACWTTWCVHCHASDGVLRVGPKQVQDEWRVFQGVPLPRVCDCGSPGCGFARLLPCRILGPHLQPRALALHQTHAHW